MKPQIKAILSPDIDDIAHYKPDDPTIFGFSLQLLIGPENHDGKESFELTVCSPEWLSTTSEADEIIVGRHYLFMFRYDYARLIRFIQGYVAGCSGATWAEVAAKLSRFGYWEFEDYRDDAN